MLFFLIIIIKCDCFIYYYLFYYHNLRVFTSVYCALLCSLRVASVFIFVLFSCFFSFIEAEIAV